VPCAKRDEIDERMTAIVWVIFPGFIVGVLTQREKGRSASFFIFVHEDADARQSRRIRCAVKCSPNFDADSD